MQTLIAAIVAIGQIGFIILSGFYLGKTKILQRQSLNVLAQCVFRVFLPALIFCNVISSIDQNSVLKLIVFPICAIIHITFAFIMGNFFCLFLKDVDPYVKKVIIGSMTFGNFTFIPLSMIAAVTSTNIFNGIENASELGTAFVSCYILGSSSVYYSFGYNYMVTSENKEQTLGFFGILQKICSPPFIAVCLGVICGLIPSVKLFLFPTTWNWSQILFDTLSKLGKAAVPLAMVVLGGNLARPFEQARLPAKAIVLVILQRFIIFPIFGIGLMMFLKDTGLLLDNKIARLVLLLETSIPSGGNLMIMCQLATKGEMEMAMMLFYVLLAYIPFAAFWTTIYFAII
eukprot:TRINITY_DN1940_c0_g1_i2.p1 TRINITY_DN1940_c0_g1~~TRINITY_DN1940_c0_g1_i2.p1  ORF type:complete len:344 (+),score=76.51 TRINITY_DN1940_c0_g1_i2:83-1114(+)